MEVEEIGSVWWIQLIFFIALNAFTYLLIELWRRYPFIWSYITVIATIGLAPLALVISDTSIFLKIKYLIVCPVMIVAMVFRTAYIPYDENTPKWKSFVSKLSAASGKVICCMKSQDSENAGANDDGEIEVYNTSKCTEWFAWTVGFVNINVAVVSELIGGGSYANAVCGVLLSISFPVPAKLLYNRHSYYTENGNLYDFVAPIHWLFFVTFTLWDFTYVLGSSKWDHIFWSSIHLLPNCIYSLKNKESAKLWIQLRIVTLTFFLWFVSWVPNSTVFESFPWFLNAGNFAVFGEIHEHPYALEVIGGFNCLLAVIHFVIFIKNIINERKKTAKEDKTKVEMDAAIKYEAEQLLH